MPHIRRATLADVALITTQRHRMFADNDLATEAHLTAMDAQFEPWLRAHLTAGTYLGLLLSDDPNPTEILAGAGVYFMDWPPHFLDIQPIRAYLLNFYTAPQARGRGYAKLLLKTAVEESHAHGAKVVTLHASAFGKPIYEKFGFTHNNEMMLRFDR
ncbi:MAG TPA: GNAT family N-acetyltransferase [Acidobacteriaceae bacterium]